MSALKTPLKICGSPWSDENRTYISEHNGGIFVSLSGLYHYARAEEIVVAVNSHAKHMATIKELSEALGPFAEVADYYDPSEGDDKEMAWSHDFTIGSLRRARAAIAAAKESE
jgi:hypothetical protein